MAKGISRRRIISGKAFNMDRKFDKKHDADYRAWTQRQVGLKARVVKIKDGYAVYTRRLDRYG